jgi:hypothetical protein
MSNISCLLACILITLSFSKCSNSRHADVEIGEVSIYQSNIIAAFKKRFDTVKPDRRQFDEWLSSYFDKLHFADEAIRRQFHLSRLFKHAHTWKFIYDVGKREGYFDYLYTKNKFFVNSSNDQILVKKELDKQIDSLGKVNVINIFRTSVDIRPHYLPRQEGYHYSIFGENYFISYNDIAGYHKNINYYSMSTDTVQNFKNLISYHFKYTFYTKHVVEDNHVSILIQNSYLDFLSACYVEDLRDNIEVRERNLLAFYKENENKFNYYSKLELKVLHFNTTRDYLRFNANGKSNFTESSVWFAIEDSLPNNSGIPEYVRKGLFYAQKDSLYFKSRDQYCLGIVVGKHDYKKISFDQAKRIIPGDIIISDILKKRLNQLKEMYKLNMDISSDSLYFQCSNAIDVN